MVDPEYASKAKREISILLNIPKKGVTMKKYCLHTKINIWVGIKLNAQEKLNHGLYF